VKRILSFGGGVQTTGILDPFSGSGTVGEVAKSLGRKAILIDASEKYCRLAVKRVQAVSYPMRLEV